jgi:hypothetical protein
MSEASEQRTIHLTGLRRMGVWLRLMWRNIISGPSEHRKFQRRYMAAWIEEGRDPDTFPGPSKVSVADPERSMERARKRVAASLSWAHKRLTGRRKRRGYRSGG